MYGFIKAYAGRKDLIRTIMQRSDQLLNEECIKSMFHLRVD